jgi:arylsulfatase A-like enzyme
MQEPRGPARSIGLAVALLALACGAEPAPSPAPHARAGVPNVLLLVADDLSPRIGAYGDAVARTPHLDALAREGVRYTRAFAVAGVCAPSRAGLLLGMHPIAVGAQHMRTTSRPEGAYYAVPPPEAKAFPELLRRAGHYTYNVGKTDYQLGPPLGGGPFTIWDANGAWLAPDHWPEDAGRGRRFFGFVNFEVTHESGIFAPLGARPHSLVHFGVQLARAFQLRGAPELPPTDPATVALPPYYADAPAMRADLARHYDDIALLDAQVGALLARLEADGLAASTIVVFTSDHGDGLPRAKRELFDSGLHVPLIVRYPEAFLPPGTTPGRSDDRLVSLVDVGPQILAWMGAEVPRPVHGRPFAGPAAVPRDFVFAQRDRIDEVVDRQRLVRDERFAYLRSWHPEVPGGHPLAFRDNQDGVRDLRARFEQGKLDAVQRQWFEPVARERLYDTRMDPHEVRDLAGDPQHAAVLARLRAALDAWLTRVGDTSEEPEAQMAERFWPGGDAPETEAPELRVADGVVTMRCATEGASIGYRVEDEDGWRLYTGPVSLEALGPVRRIEARAVRYGFEESATTRLRVDPAVR